MESLKPARTNYIHRLEDEVSELRASVGDARECLTHIRTYLLSDKFHKDTTVQVQDVLNRLESIADCLYA
jgi:hypothetical protein